MIRWREKKDKKYDHGAKNSFISQKFFIVKYQNRRRILISLILIELI